MKETEGRKVLLLSCSTGEGHNHCAMAVRQRLDAMGVVSDFFDMLHLFGEQGPISVDQLLNVISTKTPNLFGLMYRAGEKVSSLGVTSPVYLINRNYGDKLYELMQSKGYDAVICSHLFPMETLTYIRRHHSLSAGMRGCGPNANRRGSLPRNWWSPGCRWQPPFIRN